jgi:hypothetical protein
VTTHICPRKPPSFRLNGLPELSRPKAAELWSSKTAFAISSRLPQGADESDDALSDNQTTLTELNAFDRTIVHQLVHLGTTDAQYFLYLANVEQYRSHWKTSRLKQSIRLCILSHDKMAGESPARPF